MQRADYLASRSGRSRGFRGSARWIAGSLLLICGVALAAIRPVRIVVTGESMLPTLEDGDRIVVGRGRSVRAGDVVALRDPEEDGRLLVKRVLDVGPRGITVVGDNPSGSRDSRRFGPVAPPQVIGRALYRYHPPRRAGGLRRWAPPPVGATMRDG